MSYFCKLCGELDKNLIGDVCEECIDALCRNHKDFLKQPRRNIKG